MLLINSIFIGLFYQKQCKIILTVISSENCSANFCDWFMRCFSLSSCCCRVATRAEM